MSTIIAEELVSIQQVSRKPINSIPKKILSSYDISIWLSEILGNQTQENLFLICLNTKNQIISYSSVSVGTVNQSIAHPRDIFQRALLCNAARILLSHNHPSSDVTPSQNDHYFTKRIAECGEMMGIPLLDHIIVSSEPGSYYSYREEQKL